MLRLYTDSLPDGRFALWAAGRVIARTLLRLPPFDGAIGSSQLQGFNLSMKNSFADPPVVTLQALQGRVDAFRGPLTMRSLYGFTTDFLGLSAADQRDIVFELQRAFWADPGCYLVGHVVSTVLHFDASMPFAEQHMIGEVMQSFPEFFASAPQLLQVARSPSPARLSDALDVVGHVLDASDRFEDAMPVPREWSSREVALYCWQCFCANGAARDRYGRKAVAERSKKLAE